MASTAFRLRQKIIEENVSALVKSLTGFEESHIFYPKCVQAFHSAITNDGITVNPKEVQRRIDGMVQKFNVDGFAQHAAYLVKLCDALATDINCVEHYQTEIQWNILYLLFELTYNPIGAVRDDPQRIQFPNPEKEHIKKMNWVRELQEFDIPARYSSDSDLSEWSDKSEDEESDVVETRYQPKASGCHLELTPPRKADHYYEFNSQNSKSILREIVDNQWWTNRETHLLSKPQEISEYYLMREIISMFSMPTNCKFFRIKNNEVVLNENTTITGVGLFVFRYFSKTLLSKLTQVFKLQEFCQQALKHPKVPYTYTCYANALQECLKPFKEFLLDKEKQLMLQQNGVTHTLIEFVKTLETEHYRLLDNLYEIHSVVLHNWKENPAHINASYLIACLFKQMQCCGNAQQSNLMATILVEALSTFVRVIDNWWAVGCLRDGRDEFLVERVVVDGVEEFRARSFRHIQETCPWLRPEVTLMIQSDPLTLLLLEHSKRASRTLTVLQRLNRIGEIRLISSSFDCLNDVLQNNLDAKYKSFLPEGCCHTEKTEPKRKIPNKDVTDKLEKFKSTVLQHGDELLYLAFHKAIAFVETHNIEEESGEWSPATQLQGYGKGFKFYEMLNKSGLIFLPHEQIILSVLGALFEERMSPTNQYVVRMFKEEFNLMEHLTNLQRVYMLEAGDVMQQFYINLFSKIENNDNWENPYLLSVKLDDTISSKYSNMNALFRFDIRPHVEELNVVKAIDLLTLTYYVPDYLQHLITDRSLQKYNIIFRFLLKLKWGVWSLENLRFPQSMKKRNPFAPLTIIDVMFKRIAMIRNWLIYAIGNIHSHIFSSVISTGSERLLIDLENPRDLTDMVTTHEHYVDSVLKNCFQHDKNGVTNTGITKLLELIGIVKSEWNLISRLMSLDLWHSKDEGDGGVKFEDDNFDLNSSLKHIEVIERTYIQIHEYLSSEIAKQVFANGKDNLEGLCSAFLYSQPC